MCDGGIGDTFVLKLDCAGYTFALDVLDMTIVCAIMFWQCEEIPSLDQMICPCSAFVSFLMHLGFTSHWSKWHFVLIKGFAEMCVCQNIGGGIRLSNQIDPDFGLLEQLIPKVWWKVVGYTSKDAEEMGCKGAYGYLGCVASMSSWWHQFHVQFAPFTDVICVILHVL
jgi:hypothetical protein